METEDLHPLRSTTNMSQILPFFPFNLCFKRQKKKSFKHAMRKAILEELNSYEEYGEQKLSVGQLDEEILEDPFL